MTGRSDVLLGRGHAGPPRVGICAVVGVRRNGPLARVDWVRP
jgi:hypothetical protein